MHYYKRNIGDYAKKAGRLSMLQHGAYTLLIDSCYDREQFPTLEEAIDWTWASSAAEIEAVEFVLRKFFVLEDGRYVQKRIQEEISEYHEKAATNARIANEREAKRRSNNTNRTRTVHEPSPQEHETPPNQEPITKNHIKKDTPNGVSKKPPPTKKPQEPEQEPPSGLNIEAWETWKNYRVSIRKPLKPASILAAQEALSAFGSEQSEVVKQSIANGWQGLFALKNNDKKGVQQAQSQSKYAGAGRAIFEDDEPIKTIEKQGEIIDV